MGPGGSRAPSLPSLHLHGLDGEQQEEIGHGQIVDDVTHMQDADLKSLKVPCMDGESGEYPGERWIQDERQLPEQEYR